MGSYLMLHNSILDAIGQTPIVRLEQFSEDLGIEAYAKLESLNPGWCASQRCSSTLNCTW